MLHYQKKVFQSFGIKFTCWPEKPNQKGASKIVTSSLTLKRGYQTCVERNQILWAMQCRPIFCPLFKQYACEHAVPAQWEWARREERAQRHSGGDDGGEGGSHARSPSRQGC